MIICKRKKTISLYTTLYHFISPYITSDHTQKRIQDDSRPRFQTNKKVAMEFTTYFRYSNKKVIAKLADSHAKFTQEVCVYTSTHPQCTIEN